MCASLNNYYTLLIGIIYYIVINCYDDEDKWIESPTVSNSLIQEI